MVRLFPKVYILLVVLVYTSVDEMVMPVVEGESICVEGLGLCGNDCNERCSARHPGVSSSGSCDFIIKPPLCTCSYQCGRLPPPPSPPEPKRNCNGGLGLCTYKCNTPCCNANCAAKYNNGQGYCNNNAGVNLCQCQYVC